MSIGAMVFYLDKSPLKGSEKLAMVILADFADDQGECFPGVARIAHRLNLQIRPTQKLLKNLEQQGELCILQNKGIATGTGNTNRYQLIAYRNHIFGNPLPRTVEAGIPDPDDFEGVSSTPPLAGEGVSFAGEGVSFQTQGVSCGSPNPPVLDPSVLDPSEGDPSIQDLPGTTAALPPASPTAMIVNQVLAASPAIKASAVTGNVPGAIRAEAGPAAGHRNFPGQQGIIGLVQASTDKFSGNGNRNRVQCHIDGLKSKMERRGIDVPMLVQMTDKVLDEMGRTALANGESEAADTALREAQQFIADLTEIGKRFWVIDGIVSVFRSWEVNDKRPRPSYKQLLEHASLMVAGKVEKQTAGVTGPRYDFSKPDKPDKKWLLDTYQQDNLDYIVMEVPRDKQSIAKANILKKWSELCKQ